MEEWGPFKPIEYSKNTKYDPMPAKLIATLKSMNLKWIKPNSTDSIKFILIFHWFTEHFLPEVIAIAYMRNATTEQIAAKGHLQTINKAKFQFVIANSISSRTPSLPRCRSVSINSIICFHQNWQKENCINYALHWFNNDTSLLVLHSIFVVVVSFWCHWNGPHQIENGQSKSKLAHIYILWLFS